MLHPLLGCYHWMQSVSCLKLINFCLFSFTHNQLNTKNLIPLQWDAESFVKVELTFTTNIMLTRLSPLIPAFDPQYSPIVRKLLTISHCRWYQDCQQSESEFPPSDQSQLEFASIDQSEAWQPHAVSARPHWDGLGRSAEVRTCLHDDHVKTAGDSHPENVTHPDSVQWQWTIFCEL